MTNATVLVVEDDPRVRAIAVEQFEASGATVRVAKECKPPHIGFHGRELQNQRGECSGDDAAAHVIVPRQKIKAGTRGEIEDRPYDITYARRGQPRYDPAEVGAAVLAAIHHDDAFAETRAIRDLFGPHADRLAVGTSSRPSSNGRRLPASSGVGG